MSRPPGSRSSLLPMILTLLERLEQQGGSALPECQASPLSWLESTPISVDAPAPRWLVTAVSSPAESASGFEIASSGRWTSDGSLVAERSDDGVLVAPLRPRACGAAPFEGDPNRERIVWIGDLEVLSVGKAARNAGAHSSAVPGEVAVSPCEVAGRPTLGAASSGTGVDLVWALRSGHGGTAQAPRTLSLRLTLLGRPSGEVTFVNEEMDGEVWFAATRDGRMGARMRPYGELPEVELVPHAGSLRFEAAPEWRRGVEVRHPDGSRASEDRFVPGTFHWTLPAAARSAGLTIRLVEDAAPRTDVSGARTSAGVLTAPPVPNQSVDPDALLAEALTLPSRTALPRIRSAGTDALRLHLRLATELVDTDRLDVSLWSARAALMRAPKEQSSDHGRDLGHDLGRPDVVTLLLLRRLVTRLERDALMHGSVGSALVGLPRWRGFGVPSSERAEDSAAGGASPADSHALVAVEHAALAHQAVEHASALAREAGDAVLASRARRLARRLRRWFQEEFWLEKPSRIADLGAAAAAQPGAGSAGALEAFQLRPQMVMAASMEGAPLSTAQRQVIVKAAEARLLVPSLGVSTLDRDDLAYRGYSLEDGAAWPFLAGMFVEASLRAFGHDRGRQLALHRWLDSLHLDAAPMAWGHSGGAPTTAAPYAGAPFQVLHRPMPLGPLHFPLNALEGARARALLANGLPCPVHQSLAGSHAKARRLDR